MKWNTGFSTRMARIAGFCRAGVVSLRDTNGKATRFADHMLIHETQRDP